jgi:hypothetical protein
VLTRGPPVLAGIETAEQCSRSDPPGVEVFLIECLAWGLLRAYGIEEPPVPVREMVLRPLPIFEHLSLLELNLGLYDAIYRSCLDGARLIVVDLEKPRPVQRASTARALHVAFRSSARATDLCWPYLVHASTYDDLFARCLLMPAAWVQQERAMTVSTEEIATRFDVPIRMANQRLDDIACYERGHAV